MIPSDLHFGLFFILDFYFFKIADNRLLMSISTAFDVYRFVLRGVN